MYQGAISTHKLVQPFCVFLDNYYSTRILFHERFCSIFFCKLPESFFSVVEFVFAKCFFFLWVLVTNNILSFPPFSLSFYFSQPEVVVPITVTSPELFHLVLLYVSLGSKGKISVAEGKHFDTNYTCK